jgi:hypothetical protein
MEVTYFTETSQSLQITCCYNPEDRTLHGHRFENITSNMPTECAQVICCLYNNAFSVSPTQGFMVGIGIDVERSCCLTEVLS